jgi:hypothetical protein
MVLFNYWVESGIDWFGFALFVIGVICLIAIGFEIGKGWGVAMLLFGVVLWPIFVLLHWSRTNFWFFVALSGFLIMYVF